MNDVPLSAKCNQGTLGCLKVHPTASGSYRGACSPLAAPDDPALHAQAALRAKQDEDARRHGMPAEPDPIPMLLWCPACGTRHYDVGEFATRPHHTHACQECGMVWRPALVATVGVRYLPGFKNEEEET